MGSLTNYAALELLDHVFNAAYSPVSTIYLALCTADPTDAATGASMSEVANSNNYARTAIAFGAASSRQVAQSGVVTFPTASGSWGTITHWAIVDSGTHGAGNALAFGSLTEQKSVVANNTPSVASGQCVISVNAGGMSSYLVHKLLDLMFRNQAYAKPSTYVALMTATIADGDTTGTEPSGNGYARKQVNINGGSSPTWDLATSGNVDNTHAITMATASGSWGTIVAAAICDALTTGNILFYDNSVADQAVGNGDTVEFAIGNFDNNLS